MPNFTAELPPGTKFHTDAPKRSLQWLKDLCAFTEKLETYVSDVVEDWTNNESLYLLGKAVGDDCDGKLGILNIAVKHGGFELSECAHCAIDTNLSDNKALDHYVAAVWCDGEWWSFNCWHWGLVTLLDLEKGNFKTRGGRWPDKATVVKYRRLNQGYWYEGMLPVVVTSK